MIRRFVQTWSQRARGLQTEASALYLAYRDPRVPWYAKVYLVCVLAYLFSPIDLIPDFIPILGYLDELLLMPVFIAVARKLVPEPVLNEYRAQAQERTAQGRPRIWIGAVIIIIVWIVLVALAALMIRNLVL